jgi:hypothetical protein
MDINMAKSIHSELRQIKLELIKSELEAISSRKNNVVSNLWKIRQIAITLWLTILTVGLGGLDKSDGIRIEILLLSTILPLIFMILDSSESRWWYRYDMREHEIKLFINSEKYLFPKNGVELNFIDFLEDTKFKFPLYDLSGFLTFLHQKEFKQLSGRLKVVLSSNSLLFYGIQIVISVTFLSWYFYNEMPLLIFIAPTSMAFLLIILYFFGKLRTKKIINKSLKSVYLY